MDSNGAMTTTVKSAEEEVECLRKLLTESTSNAKKRDQQSFKLNCKLTQEKNKLISKLDTETKVQEKLSAEIKVLKEGMQFINGQLIKCMESLANFGVGGDDGGGIEVKLNVSSDNLGGSEMYTNPKCYFEKLFKNLDNIYISKLTSLKEESEEAEKRAKLCKGELIKLLLCIKDGRFTRKRKRESDTNCQGDEKKLSVSLATESKVVVKEDVPHPVINMVAQEIKLSYAAAAKLAIKKLEVTKVSGQCQFEETGSEIGEDDDKYDIDDHKEFPTIENAMLMLSEESLLTFEEEGRNLQENDEVDMGMEKDNTWESPRRKKSADGGAGEFGCPLCEQIFFSTFGLTAHIAEKHKETGGLRGKDSSSPPKKKARRMTMTKKGNS